MFTRIMAEQRLRSDNSEVGSSYFNRLSDNKKRKTAEGVSDIRKQSDQRDDELSSSRDEIDTEISVNERISVNSNKLSDDFYDVPCEELAVRLLGQTLVRILDDGTRLRGAIVETECYPGGDDAASHSFNGKKTERNEAMYMKPGTAYVYYIYGMYNCFNISSRGDGAAVLIRALKPLEGLDIMQEFRLMKKNGEVLKKKSLRPEHLCNGPSKLCQALKIEKKIANTQDLVTSKFLWLEKGNDVSSSDIVPSKRIGINSHGEECVRKLLRFYVLDEPCVSVRDKQAEALKRNVHLQTV